MRGALRHDRSLQHLPHGGVIISLELMPRAQRPGKPGDGKLLALDGMRGIAILLVLVFHLTSWANDRVPTPLWKVTGLGYIGVDLFFVLSGFLITGILSDARGSKAYFLNFYMRRVLRIFPLYYAVVGLVVLVLPIAAPGNPKVAEVASQQWWLWGYGVNVALAIRNQWTFYGMNHFWSLAVEEQFYLVWPVLVAVLSRERMARLCVVLVVVAAGLRYWLLDTHHWAAAYALMPCRMDELAAGGFVALVLRGPIDDAKALRVARIAVVPATLVAAFLLFGPGWLGPQTTLESALVPSALAVAFGSLHVVATRAEADSIVRRVLEWRGLRTLGQYSYGLYVLHHPLRPVFEKLFPPAWLAARLHSPVLGSLVFATLAGGLSFALAVTSFRFFESPVLALKRYFEYGRSASINPALTTEPSEQQG